jgi:Transposase DDE domain
MTCWQRLHHILLQRLQHVGHFDWERASLDSASVPAPGGETTGKDPTNRSKLGTKRNVVVDRNGLPLALTVAGSDVHDSKMLEETVDAIPQTRLAHPCRGRPRKRPVKLHADKGYDYPRCQRASRKRGIIPRIARPSIESSARLWWYRYDVERTLCWLNRLRRLRIGFERRADMHQACLSPGCALICFRTSQGLQD